MICPYCGKTDCQINHAAQFKPECETCEYVGVDAGPYCDDIFYLVCRKCGRPKPNEDY